MPGASAHRQLNPTKTANVVWKEAQPYVVCPSDQLLLWETLKKNYLDGETVPIIGTVAFLWFGHETS